MATDGVSYEERNRSSSNFYESQKSRAIGKNISAHSVDSSGFKVSLWLSRVLHETAHTSQVHCSLAYIRTDFYG